MEEPLGQEASAWPRCSSPWMLALWGCGCKMQPRGRGGSWLQSVEGGGEQEQAEGRKGSFAHHEEAWGVGQSHRCRILKWWQDRASQTSWTRCPRACREAQRPTGNGQCAAGTHARVSPPLGISHSLRQTWATPPVSWESLTRLGRRKQWVPERRSDLLT